MWRTTVTVTILLTLSTALTRASPMQTGNLIVFLSSVTARVNVLWYNKNDSNFEQLTYPAGIHGTRPSTYTRGCRETRPSIYVSFPSGCTVQGRWNCRSTFFEDACRVWMATRSTRHRLTIQRFRPWSLPMHPDSLVSVRQAVELSICFWWACVTVFKNQLQMDNWRPN